jgi:hypothetical protein
MHGKGRRTMQARRTAHMSYCFLAFSLAAFSIPNHATPNIFLLCIFLSDSDTVAR